MEVAHVCTYTFTKCICPCVFISLLPPPPLSKAIMPMQFKMRSTLHMSCTCEHFIGYNLFLSFHSISFSFSFFSPYFFFTIISCTMVMMIFPTTFTWVYVFEMKRVYLFKSSLWSYFIPSLHTLIWHNLSYFDIMAPLYSHIEHVLKKKMSIWCTELQILKRQKFKLLVRVVQYLIPIIALHFISLAICYVH